MATMNISLPDKMKEWVEAQVATGKYANVSDYMRDILRDQFEYDAKLARLRELIQAGEDSGISDQTLDDIWEDVRKHYEYDE